MFNNPVSNVDPDGDFPWLAIGIAAALHTGTHLATNKFTFNNWNWGTFAGSIAAGAIGGFVGPALEKAQIGGFYGGAILGGSSAFAHNITSGIINNNLSFKGLATSTLIGAGAGGLISGIEAESRGYRFLDGRGKIVTERHLLGTGNTPKENYHYTKKKISELNEVAGDGIKEWSPDINKGFEGDLDIKGIGYPEKGETFFVESDGKLLYETSDRGKPFSLKVSSNNKDIRWGIKGNKTLVGQSNTRLLDKGFPTITANRYNSYLRITGKHRGWDSFLFWGR